jgi:succinate dehydrogenase hydrophobic anchor subunit
MEASLSGRRKTNEPRASAVPTVISLATAMFVLPLVLSGLYLSLSSVFNTTHMRAFQFALYILLVFFALTIGVGIQYFHEDYHRPITTPLWLTVVLPEP